MPFLYISTGTGPVQRLARSLVVDEWQKLAYDEIEEMTKRGVPGVWTHGYYDGWAPNYMFYVANGHNSIGRFYETFRRRAAPTRACARFRRCNQPHLVPARIRRCRE